MSLAHCHVMVSQSGFCITLLVTPYDLEDALSTAQFQFEDYLYEKYLGQNAWGRDPLTKP